jgi:hypothetical protein
VLSRPTPLCCESDSHPNYSVEGWSAKAKELNPVQIPSDAEILAGHMIGDMSKPDIEWLYVALLHTGEWRLYTWDGSSVGLAERVLAGIIA